MTKKGLNESDSSEDTPEDEYQVERIIKVRIRGGRKEYFLKWKGYPEEENTWEPEFNLDCPELIKAFEDNLLKEHPSTASTSRPSGGDSKSRQKPKPLSSKPPSEVSSVSGKDRKRSRVSTEESGESTSESKRSTEIQSKPTTTSITRLRGFSRGLMPDRIIGATDSSGELMFLIKWKDCTEADLVPAREANVKCPQVVIRFYEERLTWHRPDAPVEPVAVYQTTPSMTTAAVDETLSSPIDSTPVSTSSAV